MSLTSACVRYVSTRGIGDRPRSRSAFSLIEVMIAMAVLAVGIMAIFSNIFTLAGTRDRARDMMQVELATIELIERVQGCSWDKLGTASLPWSLARHAPKSGGAAHPPLTEADLLNMGIISRRLGLQGLEIFVEYFRGMAQRDDDGVLIAGGLMDGEGQTFDSTSDVQKVWGNDQIRNTYRLSDQSSPTSQIGLDQTLVIRIEVSVPALGANRVVYFGRKQ